MNIEIVVNCIRMLPAVLLGFACGGRILPAVESEGWK